MDIGSWILIIMWSQNIYWIEVLCLGATCKNLADLTKQKPNIIPTSSEFQENSTNLKSTPKFPVCTMFSQIFKNFKDEL